MARWELLYEENDEQCLSLALHLGDTLHFTGELQAAELVLKEALPAARALPAFLAKLLRSLGRVKISQGDVEPGLGCYRDALRHGLMAGERNLLAELYVNLGKTLSDLERFGEAVQEMQEGVDLVTAGEGAGAADVPVGFWRLLLQLAEAEHRTGDSAGATRHAAVALDQARREGSLVGQARCHSSLAQVFEDQHRVEAAERHHAAALDTFRRLGDRQSAAECLLSRASRCPDRSQDLIQQALTLSRQVAWNEGIRAASSLLAVS
jgi:tetratricopeptide (TPR) repeat protein